MSQGEGFSKFTALREVEKRGLAQGPQTTVSRRRPKHSALSIAAVPATVPKGLPAPQFDPAVIDPTLVEPEKWPAPSGGVDTIVKLQTSDPNVVIVWLIESRGE